jgi:hypothetical protein
MESPAPAPPKKKVYEAPKLQVYGDLTEMTKTKGNRSALDGGMAIGMRRTGA